MSQKTISFKADDFNQVRGSLKGFYLCLVRGLSNKYPCVVDTLNARPLYNPYSNGVSPTMGVRQMERYLVDPERDSDVRLITFGNPLCAVPIQRTTRRIEWERLYNLNVVLSNTGGLAELFLDSCIKEMFGKGKKELKFK